MFPIYMLIVALSTLVSNGMSSLLARYLGAGDMEGAGAVFSGAHGLAVFLGGCLILLFFFLGQTMTLMAAGGSDELARMGLIYLRITVFFSPLLFVLSVNSDALRNEGRVGFMAAMSLLDKRLRWGIFHVEKGTVMNTQLPSAMQAKHLAQRLWSKMAEDGTSIGHAKSLELIVHQYGFRDWNAMIASVGNAPPKDWVPGDKVKGAYLS